MVNYWLALTLVTYGVLATTAYAQEWRYMDITIELVDQRWQYQDKDTDLLMLHLDVTNNENHFLYGTDIYLDVVVADGLDDVSYPPTYWTDGPMAESCPKDIISIAPGQTTPWRVCFEIPTREKPDFLRLYSQPMSQIIQFHTYSASCQDSYGDLCAAHTLDGRVGVDEYLSPCLYIYDAMSAECWSDMFIDILGYVLYLEERIDELIYEKDMSQLPVHRTIIKEADIQWEFYDSKDNHYLWVLPISAYEDAVVESRARSTFMGLDPLYLDTDKGETIPTVSLDGFVRGSFSNVIHDVYDNSYDDADFVWEVWHIVSQLTVYDEDIYAHSEGRYATETFSRGGGDCEDLAILIADMLVSSEHTSDWTIQYVYMDADNPEDPQTVNHVMLFVDDGERTYLIEATGKPSWDYYPDGVRGWFIDVWDGV